MGDTDRVLDVIRGRNARTVGLQFPVGLRTKAVELAQELESKAGVTCLVSADPSFGACDVPDMPVDLIVHLGHAPMPHLRYHNVLRENKIATGAGADRISEGMRAAFGAAVGTAARVKPGTKIFTISTTEDHVDDAKEALRKGGVKLPTPWYLEIQREKRKH